MGGRLRQECRGNDEGQARTRQQQSRHGKTSERQWDWMAHSSQTLARLRITNSRRAKQVRGRSPNYRCTPRPLPLTMRDMAELFLNNWPWIVGVVSVALSVATSTHVVLHKRESRAAIGWVGLIWLAPFVGCLLYYS